MSVERRKLLEAYGAEIVLTDGKKGMSGAIEKAQELHATVAGSFLAGQFENPANPAAHYATTGREIWEDTEGDLDFFVAGVGTGGTLSGAGKFLKEKIPHLKIIAVEPRGSAVLSGKAAGMHGLQGIGAGFIPATLDTAIYDEVIPTSEEDAFKACRALAKTEGVLAGISSGAALHAAATIARRSENAGKKIAVVFPDGGDRYLSTDLFS
jgi:cysteine synthase A